MILATLTYDLINNTIEAAWLEEVKDIDGKVTGFVRARCRNYSAEQRDEFLNDCADPKAVAFANAAGW